MYSIRDICSCLPPLAATPFASLMEGDDQNNGRRKVRFTPNIAQAARRAPKDLIKEEGNSAASQKNSSEVPTRGRGRGRGRGGRGGRGGGQGEATGSTHGTFQQRRGNLLNMEGPVSGPFALGPGAFGGRRSGSTSMAFSGASGSIQQLNRLNNNISGLKSENEGDEFVDLAEEMGSAWNRDAHLHLPISLVNSTFKADPEFPTATNNADSSMGLIEDDLKVQLNDLEMGKLSLWQLPRCITLPSTSDPSETSNTPTMTNGLLATTDDATEKTFDIDSFTEQTSKDNEKKVSNWWNTGMEGRVGKLRIHASGKISLIFDNSSSSSSHLSAIPSSIQGGMSGTERVVAIDGEYAQSFDLGSLDSHLVFVPNMNELINTFQ